MSSGSLVSVITIFLNAERFMEEAIESIVAQTYDRWELLLVDDGSSDGSTAIARRYAERYGDQIRYLEHEGHQNRGMSASRNLGIGEARGQYIAFLDADDVYLPQKLERQVAILDAQPAAAMVYGASEHWFSWTGKTEDLGHDIKRLLGVPPDSLVQPPTLPILFLQRKADTPVPCSVLVRREAIDRIKGFEDSFRGMYEDQVFFYKLCLHEPVFVESGCWDRYRQHPNSTCALSHLAGEYDAEGGPSPTLRTFLEWLQAYLIDHGIADRELWWAFRRSLWPNRHPVLYRLLPFTRLAKPAQKILSQARRAIEGL